MRTTQLMTVYLSTVSVVLFVVACGGSTKPSSPSESQSNNMYTPNNGCPSSVLPTSTVTGTYTATSTTTATLSLTNTATSTYSNTSTMTNTNTSSGILQSSGCGGMPVSTSPTTNNDVALNSLINSQQKKDCDAKGLMVNRDDATSISKPCLDAKADMTWCNDQGIKDKFQTMSNAGVAVAAKISEFKAQNFVIDQCGIENNKPIVTMYKKVPEHERLEVQFIRAN